MCKHETNTCLLVLVLFVLRIYLYIYYIYILYIYIIFIYYIYIYYIYIWYIYLYTHIHTYSVCSSTMDTKSEFSPSLDAPQLISRIAGGSDPFRWLNFKICESKPYINNVIFKPETLSYFASSSSHNIITLLYWALFNE